jgi:hypothetical protein
MPVWGWILVIAFLSALAVGSLFAIVRSAHRLPGEEPLHGHPTNLVAPLPLDVADAMTQRELEAEEAEAERSPVSRRR